MGQSASVPIIDERTALTSPLNAGLQGLGPATDRAQLRMIFDRYDADGSGKVSAKELRAMCKALQLDLEVDSVIKSADADQSGSLDFEEVGFGSNALSPRLERALARRLPAAQTAHVTAVCSVCGTVHQGRERRLDGRVRAPKEHLRCV